MDSSITGKFIAQLRKERNLTQNDLADLLQVTNKAISRWETGEGFPDVYVLPKLASVLNVTVDELLEGQRNEIKGKSGLNQAHLKFKNSVLIVQSIFFGAYLLFIGITYAFMNAWLGTLMYVIPALGAFIWFLVQKNHFIYESDYTNEDRAEITKAQRNITMTFVILGVMVSPQVLTLAMIGQYSNVVLTFDNYLGSAFAAGLFTFIILWIGYQVNVKKLIKNLYQDYRGFAILLILLIVLFILDAVNYLPHLVMFFPVATYSLHAITRLYHRHESLYVFLLRAFHIMSISLFLFNFSHPLFIVFTVLNGIIGIASIGYWVYSLIKKKRSIWYWAAYQNVHFMIYFLIIKITEQYMYQFISINNQSASIYFNVVVAFLLILLTDREKIITKK